MFDHLSLGVRDLGAARQFYDAFLEPLGHAIVSASGVELAYGRGGVGAQFYLYPVAPEREPAGAGTHIAFTAPSRRAVDGAYAAAIGQGASSVRAAGPHPDIAADYYGAILIDPDGNRLEIVLDTMH